MKGMAEEGRKEETAGRLRQWFAGRIRERITLAGGFYLAAVVLVGLAAFASANNLLFLLFAAMMAALMVSGFVSRLGLTGLELDVQLPEHISAREETPARVILRNEKRLMPTFSVAVQGVEGSVFVTELYFPLVPAREAAEAPVQARFPRRGVHRIDVFQFTSRFPFGFAERRVRAPMEHEVTVYPALEPQPGFEALLEAVEGDAEAQARGRGYDFYRIRPYETGESARHVDWRATAHTAQLQVREFSRQEDRSVTLVLDLESEAGAWFERAVECCAFLTWRLSLKGARVRFRAHRFDLLIPAEGNVYAILRYLALVEPRRCPVPPPDPRDDSVTLVLSARPEQIAEAGWVAARVLGPDAFSNSQPDPGAGGIPLIPYGDRIGRNRVARLAGGPRPPGAPADAGSQPG
jgi:uncharacterized protein (DUF58 family)